MRYAVAASRRRAAQRPCAQSRVETHTPTPASIPCMHSERYFALYPCVDHNGASQDRNRRKQAHSCELGLCSSVQSVERPTCKKVNDTLSLSRSSRFRMENCFSFARTVTLPNVLPSHGKCVTLICSRCMASTFATCAMPQSDSRAGARRGGSHHHRPRRWCLRSAPTKS